MKKYEREMRKELEWGSYITPSDEFEELRRSRTRLDRSRVLRYDEDNPDDDE